MAIEIEDILKNKMQYTIIPKYCRDCIYSEEINDSNIDSEYDLHCNITKILKIRVRTIGRCRHHEVKR